MATFTRASVTRTPGLAPAAGRSVLTSGSHQHRGGDLLTGCRASGPAIPRPATTRSPSLTGTPPGTHSTRYGSTETMPGRSPHSGAGRSPRPQPPPRPRTAPPWAPRPSCPAGSDRRGRRPQRRRCERAAHPHAQWPIGKPERPFVLGLAGRRRVAVAEARLIRQLTERLEPALLVVAVLALVRQAERPQHDQVLGVGGLAVGDQHAPVDPGDLDERADGRARGAEAADRRRRRRRSACRPRRETSPRASTPRTRRRSAAERRHPLVVLGARDLLGGRDPRLRPRPRHPPGAAAVHARRRHEHAARRRRPRTRRARPCARPCRSRGRSARRACSSGMSMVRDTCAAGKYTEQQTVYFNVVSAEHWGRRPRDWAELAEPSNEPLFAEVLRRLGVGTGTRLLDIGCGSGYAAAMAAGLGALRDRDRHHPRADRDRARARAGRGLPRRRDGRAAVR